MCKKPISGYIGLTVQLKVFTSEVFLQIMILKLMQKYGHKPIVFLGGGTTLIGDPSGKDPLEKY